MRVVPDPVQTTHWPRRLRWFPIAAALVFAVLLHGASGALAVELTESAGTVSARLTSDGDRFNPGSTTLRVTRSGVTSTFVGLEGEEGYLAYAATPLVLIDFDGDGELDVLAELYSGGAHCCTRSVIAFWDPADAAYRVTVRDWGDASWRLRDLDGDGTTEFLSFDPRWAYWGGGFYESGFPLQIWNLRSGALVDTTRARPDLLGLDRADQWRAFGRAKRQGRSGKGALAAYMADSYMLGAQHSAWLTVYRAYRRDDRIRFFAALRGRLVEFGYALSDESVPPVTRVPPEPRRVGCGPGDRRGIIARVHPRACVLYNRGSGDAGYFKVQALRWRRWGKPRTTARGVSVGREFDTLRVVRGPVSVRLSRLVRGCDGALWYSRARLVFPGGAATANLATCPGPF